jgi:hypothetical protein
MDNSGRNVVDISTGTGFMLGEMHWVKSQIHFKKRRKNWNLRGVQANCSGVSK